MMRRESGALVVLFFLWLCGGAAASNCPRLAECFEQAFELVGTLQSASRSRNDSSSCNHLRPFLQCFDTDQYCTLDQKAHIAARVYVSKGRADVENPTAMKLIYSHLKDICSCKNRESCRGRMTAEKQNYDNAYEKIATGHAQLVILAKPTWRGCEPFVTAMSHLVQSRVQSCGFLASCACEQRQAAQAMRLCSVNCAHLMMLTDPRSRSSVSRWANRAPTTPPSSLALLLLITVSLTYSCSSVYVY